MLAALVSGTTDATVPADLAKGKLRAKLPALRAALSARFRGHHAFLVTQILTHLDYLDELIATASMEVETQLGPFEPTLMRLDAVPGINRRTAEVIVAELGLDMSVFPTVRHATSWVGLCPRNNESAGKHKAGTTRKGNRWLRTALVEAATAAIRTKDSPFGVEQAA
jgi:transposase